MIGGLVGGRFVFIKLVVEVCVVVVVCFFVEKGWVVCYVELCVFVFGLFESV